MKNIKRSFSVIALLLAAAMLISSCGQLPKNRIQGRWMDSTGKQGYEFLEDGRAKIIFFKMNLSDSGLLSSLADLVGIGSDILDGSYDGAYTMDAKEKTLTVTYTIFRNTKTSTYNYEFVGSGLMLSDLETGKSVTYFLQPETNTTL
ncbi:MAG: hypothetical protein FWF08_01980 [Oscillospiraceae bacterium]|nr:hypothetical protein [Oscillospiraceae bacterium]